MIGRFWCWQSSFSNISANEWKLFGSSSFYGLAARSKKPNAPVKRCVTHRLATLTADKLAESTAIVCVAKQKMLPSFPSIERTKFVACWVKKWDTQTSWNWGEIAYHPGSFASEPCQEVEQVRRNGVVDEGVQSVQNLLAQKNCLQIVCNWLNWMSPHRIGRRWWGTTWCHWTETWGWIGPIGRGFDPTWWDFGDRKCSCRPWCCWAGRWQCTRQPWSSSWWESRPEWCRPRNWVAVAGPVALLCSLRRWNLQPITKRCHFVFQNWTNA